MMTDAEILIEIANGILYPRNRLLLVEDMPEYIGSTVALALRLRTRPDVVLRATMEGWTKPQIVRELH